MLRHLLVSVHGSSQWENLLREVGKFSGGYYWIGRHLGKANANIAGHTGFWPTQTSKKRMSLTFEPNGRQRRQDARSEQYEPQATVA